MSRAYTVEEMRDMLVDHFRNLAKYWAKTDLSRPEFKPALEKDGETLYRLEGLLFSILVTLDGGSMGLPAFNITASPHPEDKKFHRENGENWWPEDVVINECQLHDILSSRGRES
jgi:hypothetical protein